MKEKLHRTLQFIYIHSHSHTRIHISRIDPLIIYKTCKDLASYTILFVQYIWILYSVESSSFHEDFLVSSGIMHMHRRSSSFFLSSFPSFSYLICFLSIVYVCVTVCEHSFYGPENSCSLCLLAFCFSHALIIPNNLVLISPLHLLPIHTRVWISFRPLLLLGCSRRLGLDSGGCQLCLLMMCNLDRRADSRGYWGGGWTVLGLG